jgi:hypothetical protein
VLALDGGGVRGAISLAFLERIEEIFAAHSDPAATAPRLCDRFDLIGGTSTGAIIGTALALGLRAAEVRRLYFELAPRVFRKSPFRLRLFQSVFDGRSLKEEIARLIGDRPLETPDLLTSLAIVTKRMDTGGSWIVTNNPRSKYWDDPPDRSYVGNRHYRLADLVRASTAAPYYFAPQKIEIVSGERPGLFVDGGITPHNNPALALLQVATIPAYGFGWPLGAERLLIVSVGTGNHRDSLSYAMARTMPAAGLAVQALKSMVKDSGEQVLTMMQILGRTDTPWLINSEIGDLNGVRLPAEPLFTFQRYDIRLRRDWLKEVLGVSIGDREMAGLIQMENARMIPRAYEIGRIAAERFVKPEHLLLAPPAPGT